MELYQNFQNIYHFLWKKKKKKENKCKNLNICQDLMEFGKILTPKSLKKKKRFAFTKK
jgi:hypothetical protein